MSRRKFVTEYSIGYINDQLILTRPTDLMSGDSCKKSDQDAMDACNLYFILSRPCTYFIPETVTYTDGLLSGRVGYKVNGDEFLIDFDKVEFGSGDLSKVEIEVEGYPHRNVWAYNKEEIDLYYASYHIALSLSLGTSHELNKYKVLYVGQAIGDGNRSAQDRLKSHSTLQKILAETMSKNPDNEIFLLLASFDHEQIISSMDGRARHADQSSLNEDRLFNAINNPPIKKQKISLVEAGLIRYFQPEYNDKFKIKFPSLRAKVLESCKKLDISGLVVELNTDDLGVVLFSDNVTPKFHHLAQYDLLGKKDRASFFEMTIGSMPGVIKAK